MSVLVSQNAVRFPVKRLQNPAAQVTRHHRGSIKCSHLAILAPVAFFAILGTGGEFVQMTAGMYDSITSWSQDLHSEILQDLCVKSEGER